MKSKSLCETKYCRNKHAPGRRNCYKCKSRKYIENNPIKITFYWIRQSAKKRSIQFDLTMESWIKFIKDSGYIEGRGREKNSLTVDRIDGNKGYTLDNIRVITKSENSSKYHDKENEYPLPF